MRDPKRVNRIVSKLMLVWAYNPDWRLAQLVYNACNSQHLIFDNDIFDIEDNEIEVGLDHFINQYIEKQLERLMPETRRARSGHTSPTNVEDDDAV